MPTKSEVMWSMKELTMSLRARQLNKFDVVMGVSGRRGNGKCEIKGSKVLMSNGLFKNIEEVEIGDEVISPQEDGTFTYEKVLHTHSRFEKETYDICEATRSKRLLYSCAWNHEIPLYRVCSKRIRKDGKLTNKRIFGKKLCLKNAKNLSKHYTDSSHYTSFTSPALEFKNYKDLNIDPYSLGVFLGDGSFTDSLNITSSDFEIIEAISKTYPIMKVYNKSKNSAKMYRFSILGEFAKKLKLLDLRYKKSHNKFIPEEFLKTSIDYRLNLLAGLIDTDGFISKDNQITICTKSNKLAKDIERLVFSLGGYSLIRKVYKNCQSFKRKRLYYDISVQFKNPKIIPLKLKRKFQRLRIRKIDPRRIAIKSVRRKNGSMVYGFSISGKSKWYVTNNYMVTHNSTFIFKFFNYFKKEGFNQEKHQVYKRDDVMRLLGTQKFGFCWDDEAINSGYKRDFQNAGQKELIKIITNYRDNHNILASALPFFYSLDRDLRELVFIHIHIIERGLAVILMPLDDQIHATDPWDTKANIKIEEQENKRINKNPDNKFRYHRLTTFAGYLFFGDMTPKQRKKYEDIKQRKRDDVFNLERFKNDGENFMDKLYKSLLRGKLTKEGIFQVCDIENKKYSSITSILNRMLTDNGESKTVKDFLQQPLTKVFHNKTNGEISNIIPDL